MERGQDHNVHAPLIASRFFHFLPLLCLVEQDMYSDKILILRACYYAILAFINPASAVPFKALGENDFSSQDKVLAAGTFREGAPRQQESHTVFIRREASLDAGSFAQFNITNGQDGGRSLGVYMDIEHMNGSTMIIGRHKNTTIGEQAALWNERNPSGRSQDVAAATARLRDLYHEVRERLPAGLLDQSKGPPSVRRGPIEDENEIFEVPITVGGGGRGRASLNSTSGNGSDNPLIRAPDDPSSDLITALGVNDLPPGASVPLLCLATTSGISLLAGGLLLNTAVPESVHWEAGLALEIASVMSFVGALFFRSTPSLGAPFKFLDWLLFVGLGNSLEQLRKTLTSRMVGAANTALLPLESVVAEPWQVRRAQSGADLPVENHLTAESSLAGVEDQVSLSSETARTELGNMDVSWGHAPAPAHIPAEDQV